MNARKIAAIMKKDLSLYFVSPMGYVVLAVFFLVTGFFFNLIVQQSQQANISPVFQNTVVLLLFLAPLITMRLWSEEEKSGTAELLKTSPLTLWEIVLGKYLAVCGFFGVMLSSTVVYWLVLLALGNPDPGVVFSNYVGYILVGMAFFALGFLASTMSENQMVSAVIAYGLLIMLWVIGVAGGGMDNKIGDFVKYLSIFNHTSDFFSGVVDLSHVFYFVSLIFLSLFFSVKVLEGRRN